MKAKLLIFGFSIAIFATGAPFTPRAEAYQDYALSFDGGDRVTITNRPALNPSEITAECWVNFSDLMREHPMLDARLAGLGEADAVVLCAVVRGEILYGLGRLAPGQRAGLRAAARAGAGRFGLRTRHALLAERWVALRVGVEGVDAGELREEPGGRASALVSAALVAFCIWRGNCDGAIYERERAEVPTDGDGLPRL